MENENQVYIKTDKKWNKTLEYSNEERTPWTITMHLPEQKVEEVKKWSFKKVEQFLLGK